MELAELLDDLAYFFLDHATSLSCGEANSVADAYRGVGEPGTAQNVLESHAIGDDHGDEHWWPHSATEPSEELVWHLELVHKIPEGAVDIEAAHAIHIGLHALEG